MTRALPILAAGVAATALLATTGCGRPADVAVGPAGAQPSASAPADPVTTPTPEPGSDAGTGDPGSGVPKSSQRPSPDASDDPSSAPSNDPGLRKPFATLRGALEEKKVLAEIYPIERGGTTATANIRFSLRKPDLIGFRIYRSLSDNKPELGDSGKTAPDGLRLIDQDARKAYLPATIDDGECLCSPRVNGVYDRHHDLTVTVTFAAPPPSVTTIDLMVPGFGTVGDVPLR